MLLRTIEVSDADGQLLNAVVLCGFTATYIDRQFLVYSLNEKLGDNLIKIYLSPLKNEGSVLNLCNAPPEILTTATQVLKSIIHDACSTKAIQTESTYAVMDLGDTEIQSSVGTTPHCLKISEAWLRSLLSYHPSSSVDTSASPSMHNNFVAPSIPNDDSPSKTANYCASSQVHYMTTAPVLNKIEPLMYATGGASAVVSAPFIEPAAPAPSALTGNHLAKPLDQNISKKIETNLKSLIASVTNHKETLLAQYVELKDRQEKLEQRERLLLIRELALSKQEDELAMDIRSLQAAEQQINNLMRS
jgi:hypothetical protein